MGWERTDAPLRDRCHSTGLAVFRSDRGRKGRTLQPRELRRRAAGFGKLCAVGQHGFFFFHPAKSFAQYLCCADMRRHHDPVVHPLPFPPCLDDAGASQIGQMPRNLRLWLAENFDKVANANLLIAHEVQKAKPRLVAQGLKKTLDIEGLFTRHGFIFALTNIKVKEYSRLGRYVLWGVIMTEQLLDSVKAKYGAVAESTLSSDHAGVKAIAEAFGYSPEELTSIPANANMGLSCGNPTATAHLKPGETIVDLGSGGGLDVFLASKMIGPTGRAIGIDMTPAMIERARTNATAAGYTNVEFRLATIDQTTLPDASVDCIISNCVLNLAPDKPAVFREIFRILKPGGRVAVSDIALKAELPEEVAKSLAAYVGCIAGAIRIEDYRAGLLAAGFEYVEIVDSHADLNAYAKVENQSGCCSPAMEIDSPSCCSPSEATSSLHEDLTSLLSRYDVNVAAAIVKVYAIKPVGAASCCGPACCPPAEADSRA